MFFVEDDTSTQGKCGRSKTLSCGRLEAEQAAMLKSSELIQGLHHTAIAGKQKKDTVSTSRQCTNVEELEDWRVRWAEWYEEAESSEQKAMSLSKIWTRSTWMNRRSSGNKTKKKMPSMRKLQKHEQEMTSEKKRLGKG